MTAFDTMSFFVLLYDLFVTPYVLNWDNVMQGLLNIMSYTPALYWNADFVLSLLTEALGATYDAR